MKTLKTTTIALAAAAALAAGCILTSGQIFAHFDLPDPFTINSTSSAFERVVVDLNTIEEYEEHKDKLKGLSDVALVGRFTNVGGQAGAVEVWMTAGITNHATATEVRANGVRLWGPGTLPAGAGAVRTIGWDESAALFTAEGKRLLIQETKGDGTFTIYAIGTAGTYEIRVDNGALILTISAGI